MANRPLDLYAFDPAAKRAMEAEDRFKADLKTKNKFQARPKTGSTASAPRRGGVERTADRLAAFGVPLSVTEAIKDVDRNLLGFDETAQSLRNIIGGDGSAGDYVNAALSVPVIGGLAAKPVEMLAAKAGRGAMNLGRRAMGTRAGRYLTEARPLLDNADDAIETAFTVTPGVQRRITNQRPVVQGLPAPEQRLGLPAPGPGLPDFAAKPRGGQWWTESSPYGLMNPAVSSKENIYLGARFSSNPTDKALLDWWDKALPRYIQNDFATPDDPFRALADKGYIQGVENAAQWSNRVKSDVIPMPLQKLLFDPKTAETGVRDETLAAMPWVGKMPATENIYGFWPREETIGALSHIRDEMVNALKPDISGIPADLAVRPESLGRMSFAQAAERVGQINQWRAKQAEQAQLSALNNPALSVFKEYSDDPRGMRWVELRAPEMPEGYTLDEATGEIMTPYGSNGPAGGAGDPRRPLLEEALRYEGDTMGHCVGGYCPDVMSGRSRIFSLRDAKGEPHVTIETKPGDQSELYRQAIADLRDTDYWDAWLENQRLRAQDPGSTKDLMDYMNAFRVKQGLEPLGVDVPYDIKQIKGKQNLKPKDEYLPFVQDFVKSGQWGRVGDFEHTGLFDPQAAHDAIRATREIHPDQQRQLIDRIVDTISKEGGNPDALDEWEPPRGFEDVWHAAVRAGRGYARGGRAFAAKPCSCDHSLAVR